MIFLEIHASGRFSRVSELNLDTLIAWKLGLDVELRCAKFCSDFTQIRSSNVLDLKQNLAQIECNPSY